MKQKGFALIAIIILITFVAIAVSAGTSFVLQRLTGYNTDQIVMRCRYNAQAGLQYALYQYRQSGTLTSGTVNIDSNNYCVVSTTSAGGGSGAATNLLIDARGSSLASSNRNLVGITLKNTSTASSIIIDRALVTWTGSRKMQEIWINGIQVWPAAGGSGSATSPANVNINNFTLSANTTYPLTYIRWSSSVNGQTIALQFQMTDTTLTPVCPVFSPPATTCQAAPSTLAIKSMGKVTGSNIFKSVQATYTISSGNISDYKEYLGSVP